jgi:hypothetical protein
MIIVPDEWAGRRVRCLGCNKVLLLPYPDEGAEELEDISGPVIDLSEMASPSVLDDAEEPYFPDVSRQVIAQKKPAKPAGEGATRTCPKCGRLTKAADAYSEVLCPHCWTPIPAMAGPGKPKATKEAAPEVFRLMSLGMAGSLPTAFPYAARAWPSLLPGMFLGLLGLVAPLIVLIAVAMTSGEDPGFEAARLDQRYAYPVVLAVIVLECFYFLLVGSSATVVNISHTLSASPTPEPLSWNLSPAKTLRSVLAALAVYGALILCMALLCGVVTQGSWDGLYPANWPVAFWVTLLLVLSLMPMSLVGLASQEWSAGLNPIRLGKAVGRTIGPYLMLLVLILVLVVMIWAVLLWAGARIMLALGAGQEHGLASLIAELAFALPMWALATGVALFGAYVIARWLGLFALIHRNRLPFAL